MPDICQTCTSGYAFVADYPSMRIIRKAGQTFFKILFEVLRETLSRQDLRDQDPQEKRNL